MSTSNAQQTALKFLTYFGALLILCGLSIYISTEWININSIGRIIITLGSGIVFFVLSVLTLYSENLRKLSAPFLILSAVFQSVGLFVFLYELNILMNHYSLSQMLIYGFLFFQYLIYWLSARYKQNTAILFFVLFFGTAFFLSTFKLMMIQSDYAFVTAGVSLMCISYGLSQTKYIVLTPWGYFFGACMLMSGLYNIMEKTSYDYLFFIPAGLLIYLSALVRSKTLLFVGTLNLIFFIGYYTARHFMNVLSWPLLLMAAGFVMLLISAIVLTVNKKINFLKK
jgi:hypothetical protein